MTNGEPVVARVAMKPLATLNRPVLKTVDVVTKEETVSFKERTDVTAVPAMGVVAETMMALVLAGEALRKFGGDSVAELVRNHDAYLASLHVEPIRDRPAAGAAHRDDGGGQDDDRPPAGRPAGLAVPRQRRRDRAAHRADGAGDLDGATASAFRAEEARVLAEATTSDGPVVVVGGRRRGARPRQPAPDPRRPGWWCGCGPRWPRWPRGWAPAPAGRCSGDDPAAALARLYGERGADLRRAGRRWSSTSTGSTRRRGRRPHRGRPARARGRRADA